MLDTLKPDRQVVVGWFRAHHVQLDSMPLMSPSGYRIACYLDFGVCYAIRF